MTIGVFRNSFINDYDAYPDKVISAWGTTWIIRQVYFAAFAKQILGKEERAVSSSYVVGDSMRVNAAHS